MGPPGYGQPAPPSGGPVAPAYPTAPSGVTGYSNPTSQPSQPGYANGNSLSAGTPGGTRGSDANAPGSPPLVQEPPKTYDPNQAFNVSLVFSTLLYYHM